jgi:hypothetical protein
MAANQTREPAGAPEATAGSRRHLQTVAVVGIWLLLTIGVAIEAAGFAAKGHDPTIYLGLLCLSWMFLTPWVFRSLRRPGRKDSR